MSQQGGERSKADHDAPSAAVSSGPKEDRGSGHSFFNQSSLVGIKGIVAKKTQNSHRAPVLTLMPENLESINTYQNFYLVSVYPKIR